MARKILTAQLRLAVLGSPNVVPDEAVKDENERTNFHVEDLSTEEEFLEEFEYDEGSFSLLPPEIQQEILVAKKEQLYVERRQSHLEMKSVEAKDFSAGQIEALVKRRKLAAELEKVRSNSEKGFNGRGMRIASDSRKEFILIKNESVGWSLSNINATSRAKPEEVDIPQKQSDDESYFMEQFFGNEPKLEIEHKISNSNEAEHQLLPSETTKPLDSGNLPEIISSKRSFPLEIVSLESSSDF
jgi:hypothetical protein